MALCCLTPGHTHLRQQEPSPSVYSILSSCSQEKPLLKKGKLVKGFGWPSAAWARGGHAHGPTATSRPRSTGT